MRIATHREQRVRERSGMIRRWPLIAFALILGVAGPTLAQDKRPGVWAQTYTGRKADPAIRFGQLPNGLRYAIMHNATPPGQLSLRLDIGSGSLAEREGQQGLAHFLEHMAFRGSVGVPDGELNRILQRKGLALGADTNAFTTQEATVYKFDFPHSDRDSLDTGLMLFDEIAERLTLAPASIDAERGVVQSEERLRDSPAFRALQAQLRFTLPGQLAADRWPIGKPEVIAHATAGNFRAFYDGNYRPENAVIVAVGDIDADLVEAQIKARFGGWTGRGAAAAAPDVGQIATRGEQARIFSERGAPQGLQISWIRPYDNRADTDARERADLGRLFVQLILNQRFADLARQPNPPFLGAGFIHSNALKSADVSGIVVGALPDKQTEALAAAVAEQRRLLRDGVTQAELDRARATLDAALGNGAAGSGTRTSASIADTIVGDANSATVVISPAQFYLEAHADLPTVTVAEVNAAAAATFTGAGPIVFLTTAQPPAGGEAALLAAYDAANAATIGVAATAKTGIWPYSDFGPPGRIADRREIAALGATVVRFANGVRLTVKPTSFTQGQILVEVAIGRGRLDLPRDRARSYWMVNGAAPVFIEGGTGKLASGELQRLLSAKVVRITQSMFDDAFYLSGQTQPKDFATQLQLLTAFIADPGYRPEALTRMRGGLGTVLPQADTTPSGIVGRDLGVLLHSGDRRWAMLPTAADLAATTADDLRAILTPALASPVDVTIVGDVTVDVAIAEVAATLATLPSRPDLPAITERVALPAPPPQPVVLHHRGRADQSIALAVWPTLGTFDNLPDSRALQVVAAVVRSRLYDRLREAEGATYTPQVVSTGSSELAGYGYLLVELELPPAKIAGFYTTLAAILADLRDRPVGDDELERAKRPIIDERLRDRQTNGYWLGALTRAERDRREVDAIGTRVTDIERVRPDDVQRLARRYLKAGGAYRLTVLPEAVKASPSAG